MAGRKRAPLAGSGTQAELAQRLRNLRDAHGLTLRQLAAKSGYSSGALSQAESGRGVPSWELVASFVQTCGEDPVQWRHLWELTRTAPAAAVPDRPLAAPAVPPSRPAAPAAAGPHPPPGRIHRRRIVLSAALAAIAAAAAIIAWPTAKHPQTAALAQVKPSVSAVAAARDNTDPHADGCTHDVKTLDTKKVYHRNGSLFGSIVLIYSRACQAEWGYLAGPNSARWTSYINAYRVPGPGITRWHFTGNEAFGSWGNVLSAGHGCVYAEAYVADKDGEGPHARTACIEP